MALGGGVAGSGFRGDAAGRRLIATRFSERAAGSSGAPKAAGGPHSEGEKSDLAQLSSFSLTSRHLLLLISFLFFFCGSTGVAAHSTASLSVFVI